MLKYAKVINEDTKECEVGLGTNIVYYESLNMTEQEVEQAKNGKWYLEGYIPSKKTWYDYQVEINELKTKLTASDWVGSKLLDAQLRNDPQYESLKQKYMSIIQQREQWRIDINKLEEEAQECEPLYRCYTVNNIDYYISINSTIIYLKDINMIPVEGTHLLSITDNKLTFTLNEEKIIAIRDKSKNIY